MARDVAWEDEVLRTPLERRGVTARPAPPESCGEEEPVTFVPDSTLAEWIRDTFIAGLGPLANERHEHLMDASIGVLWTNSIYVRQERPVSATAEIPGIQAGGWKRARYELQMREWFGAIPDFLLTFYAPDCLRMNDRAFCALVEHELLHCAQKEDGFGSPRFGNDGQPIFCIRGHDSEEFVDVVRRYGIQATGKGTRDLVAAASTPPLFDGPPIELACGAC